jgi:hypothetical protein
MWKMQYKSIENCHVENVVLWKDFNLGATGFFFHDFIHMGKFEMGKGSNLGWPGVYPLIFG